MLLNWRIWNSINDLEGRRVIVWKGRKKKRFGPSSHSLYLSLLNVKGLLISCPSLDPLKVRTELCGPAYGLPANMAAFAGYHLGMRESKCLDLSGWRHSSSGLYFSFTIGWGLHLPLWISHISASYLSSIPHLSYTPKKTGPRSLKMIISSALWMYIPLLQFISSCYCTIDRREHWTNRIDTGWHHSWRFLWIFRT